MSHRRFTAVAVMTTATALALSGCISGTSAPSSGGGGSASGGKVTITFSSYAFQDETVKATQQIVDSWNQSHPDIQVDYQKVDPNSVHDKLVTQFAGGEAPDVIHDEAADIAGFSRQGYLADLGPLLSSSLKSDVPDSVWKSVTVDGKVAGVPTIAQVYNVFANTAALKKANIAVPTTSDPWTWDDLAANAKKLTADGNYGFAWGLKSPTAGLMSSGLAYGGTYFSGDGAKPSISVGADELQVPKRVRQIIVDGSMAPTSTSQGGSDVLPAFFAGKYAMIMAGNYVEAQIEQKAPSGFDWTMLPILKGTTQAQASDPQTLSISRQSQHPQQAMQFIEWFMQAKNLAAVAKGDALIPVTTSAAKIASQDLTDHGWPSILAAGADLVPAPWQEADKFPQWKSETATPAFQKYLAGKIDEATLTQQLTQGWTAAQN